MSGLFASPFGAMLRFYILFPFCLFLADLVRCATVTYNWDVTWVWANPDGFARPVIGINNEWPCPTIEATVGDTVVINVNNKLGNQTSGLHFHGINQILSPDMDGPSGVTQCPLPPGDALTYKFVADAPGTYWCMSPGVESLGNGPFVSFFFFFFSRD